MVTPCECYGLGFCFPKGTEEIICFGAKGSLVDRWGSVRLRPRTRQCLGTDKREEQGGKDKKVTVTTPGLHPRLSTKSQGPRPGQTDDSFKDPSTGPTAGPISPQCTDLSAGPLRKWH